MCHVPIGLSGHSLLRFIVSQSLKLLFVEFRTISDFRKINVTLNPPWNIIKLCKTLYEQEYHNSIIKNQFYRVVQELEAKIKVVTKSCIVAMVAYNTVKMTNLLNNLLNNISGLKLKQKLCFETFYITGFSNSTDWFREKSKFSIIATACTERLVTMKTRAWLCLSCKLFSICNERPG